MLVKLSMTELIYSILLGLGRRDKIGKKLRNWKYIPRQNIIFIEF